MRKTIIIFCIYLFSSIQAEYLYKIKNIDKVINISSEDGYFLKSCKSILESGRSTGSGVYTIQPLNESFEVYCDMDTDGGGWTAVSMLADTTTRNLFETNNNNKINDINTGITAGKLSEMWTDNLNKDILIRGWSNDSLRHNNFNPGMIIYDYQKSDIENLTKSYKQNTTFSTKDIILKNIKTGVTTTASNTYGSSGSSTSHYIKASNGNYFFDMYIMDSFYYRGNTTQAYPGGLADYSGVSGTLYFSSENYFVVFIR